MVWLKIVLQLMLKKVSYPLKGRNTVFRSKWVDLTELYIRNLLRLLIDYHSSTCSDFVTHHSGVLCLRYTPESFRECEHLINSLATKSNAGLRLEVIGPFLTAKK